MSQPSQLTIVIPSQVAQDVRTHLQAAIDALAPYVHTLTPEQRQQLPKMGNNTLSFVSKVISYTDTNPAFTPSYLVVTEMKNDFNAVAALKPLLDLAAQLHSSLDDSTMLGGSETYTGSLMYYGNVREAAKKNVADAKVIYKDLQERFPGVTKPPKPKL